MELMAHEQPANAELRNFGLLLGALLAAIFGLLPWLRHRSIEHWPWIVAAALWLAALTWPRSLAWPRRGWMRLGHMMGWLNTRVILTLVFAFAVTPLAFILWVFGRDRMKRGFDPKCESYRVPSQPHPSSSMEKPF
jgi:Saxitoxin biosynthesis operon protein SxtJ